MKLPYPLTDELRAQLTAQKQRLDTILQSRAAAEAEPKALRARLNALTQEVVTLEAKAADGTDGEAVSALLAKREQIKLLTGTVERAEDKAGGEYLARLASEAREAEALTHELCKPIVDAHRRALVDMIAPYFNERGWADQIVVTYFHSFKAVWHEFMPEHWGRCRVGEIDEAEHSALSQSVLIGRMLTGKDVWEFHPSGK